MEQLVFVGIIVAFSILDAVLRGKKKGAEGSDGLPVPPPKEEWAEADWEGDEPTYDADAPNDDGPSYDDGATQEDRVPREIPVRSGPQPSGSMPAKQLWEEIAELSAPRRTPQPTPPALTRKAEVASQVPLPKTKVGTIEEHSIHRSHAGYGTDPSTRARSAEDGLDPLAQHLGKDAALARLLLSSGNAHSLRQAVILQELLGPPAAYRE